MYSGWDIDGFLKWADEQGECEEPAWPDIVAKPGATDLQGSLSPGDPQAALGG